MLTTIPYSDAAGINNAEWDAVCFVEFCLKFAVILPNFGLNNVSYWSCELQTLDWLMGPSVA